MPTQVLKVEEIRAPLCACVVWLQIQSGPSVPQTVCALASAYVATGLDQYLQDEYGRTLIVFGLRNPSEVNHV